MSAIDTFTHAHVANFFHLPVYWVFEEGEMSHLTDNANDDGIMMDKFHLSIGGGSGEHPALIINNDAVLFRFLSNIADIEQLVDNPTEEDIFDYKMVQLAQEIDDKFHDKANNYKNPNEEITQWRIDQNQWPLETFVRIAKEFRQTSDKKKERLEKCISDAVALFIIYEMPLEHCIQDKQLIEFANMFKSNRWQNAFNYQEIRDMFDGFTGLLNCQKSGKIIRDNKAVWGYSLNDWLKDNQ